MAELNQAPAGAAKPKKIRRRKLNSRVDLTAMVDLAFLLITFFMLTTSLSKPKSMNLSMPDPNGEPGNVDEHRTMTILIGDHNTAYCYMGFPSEKNEKKVVLGTNALRQELARRNKEALAYSEAKGKKGQGLIVIIKPGKKSSYGNLVDVLDEMAISNIGTYAISEIDKKEIDLLEK
ncbi:ExbD/TolR family protein [Flavobacterium sp.]|uniref:ExbD/TolR family protein n=1 Tax=Flavobacterium sp. TaxID=239 RepID=UPI0039E3B85A